MNNMTFKRAAGTLATWAKIALAQSVSRQNILVTAGATAVAVLSAPLLYRLATERHDIAADTSALVSAYHSNGSIALACFAAIAAGYCYWMLQVLAGAEELAQSSRVARWSNVAFLAVLGSMLAALVLWNIGVFVR